MSLPELPEECLWARCACAWWIATRAQISKQVCPHCECKFMKATKKDFEDVGIDTTVEPKILTAKEKKNAKGKDRRQSGPAPLPVERSFTDWTH